MECCIWAKGRHKDTRMPFSQTGNNQGTPHTKTKFNLTYRYLSFIDLSPFMV